MVSNGHSLEKPRLRRTEGSWFMRTTLSLARNVKRLFLSSLLVGCLLSIRALAQTVAAAPVQQPSGELRDGQHDFDFNIGTWKIHTRLLLHPLMGSNDWVDLNGTVHVRKVWNGRAQLEGIEADGSTGHFEGLTLFLYNPKAHQWGQYFVDSAGGVLNQPQIGELKNGRGELFGQESFNGRTIFVRSVWSDITPNSHHVEHSFSDDGGKTWQPNFVATLTRDEEALTGDEMPLPSVSSAADGTHDFDFNFGGWKTHIHRLQKPLTGSGTWTDYDATSVVSKVWGGRASLFELAASGPPRHLERVRSRPFNPQSPECSLA